MKQLIPKSKRLKSATLVLIANFAMFLYGIHEGADLQSLGTGLAMLNAPLYMYLWGETSRPSSKGSEVFQ
tara:strand:+ start:1026 stop:1235 length:210 start_codon:yes stop_codon:yes gene_type:complete